ncbi:MAG: agmatine deiminase family protein [Syntrophotaleaceae bacterium]
MSVRLPAEWEPQDGVLLAWPHEKTDWEPVLLQVEPVFARIATEISRFEQVLIVAPDKEKVQAQLVQTGTDLGRVRILEIPSNDTWSRDFGPICLLENGRPVLLDYVFNGWGNKFSADLDNRINRQLQSAGCFGDAPLRSMDLVLEGGSIESDGRGTLLTTTQCLLNPNRNPHLNRDGLEKLLKQQLGVSHFLWLNHGWLAGDDTDSHIDTLARLAPEDTILYVSCDDTTDEHYLELAAMQEELRSFRTAAGRPYRLLPLPWPRAQFDESGERLPATYANFLVINEAVLVPVYGDTHDARALETIGKAFPGRAIIGIDCSPLILQHGSLHCVTMQLPRGVLS